MPPLISVLLIVGVLAGAAVVWAAYRLGGRRARRAAVELTNLNEIGRQLLRSQLSVDGLCELVYWQAGQIIPTTLFQLGLFDGDAYQVKVWVKDSVRQDETIFPEGGRKGIVGWVRETGKPLLVTDYEAERASLPAFPEHEVESPPRSGLFVPLIAGASTLGVIAIQARQPGRFTHEHLRLLTAIANQAAWAIRNAQLYEHARERAEKLRLIGEVSTQVSSVQPLPDLFRQIVTLTQKTFGYYCVSIFVYDEDLYELRIGATTSDVFLKLDPQIRLGEGMIGWAVEHAEPAVANSVADDPRYRQLGVLPETQSEVSLPLKVEDRVLGVLDVQSDELSAFHIEDLFLLETLAAQVAVAIEQAQTYEVERQLAQRLEALMQVTQAVVSILDLNDLLEEIVDLIADTFGFERVHIFLRTGDHISFRAGAGAHSVNWRENDLTYRLTDSGIIAKAARTGQPQRVEDVTQSPDYQPGPGLEDTRSELAIPIQMGTQVLGVIDLQSEEPAAFSEDDVSLMRALSDSVAVALRNAMLYVTERRRRRLADTLREISSILVSDLDLDRVLSDILMALSRVVTLDAAAILLVEDGADALTVAAITGPADLADIVGREVPLDALDIAEGRTLEEAVSHVYHELLEAPEGHSCINAPLTAGGRLIGYLIVDNHLPEDYSVEDTEIVHAFANQAAIALNNASLYTAQQSEAWVTTALLQVAEAVNAQVEVGEALETIAHLTTLLAGVGQCVILRWEPDEDCFRLSASYGVHGQHTAALSTEALPSDRYPYLDLLTVADQPLGAGEGHQLPIPEPLHPLFELPSIMAFPLRAKHESVGVLLVDDPRRGRPLDPRLRNILTGIAHQAATVLETAVLQQGAAERDRLEQELEVARSIQASFIPLSPPQAPGWQMAALWRAARQVSGDFYDFIRIRDGLWGLAVADVADKGIPAALFMAMCRTLLRAAAVSRTSPAATLRRLNQLLFNDSRSDLFVTVFYAVWNPDTGEVTYASAGHNPPLLLRSGEPSAVELRSKGIALNVIADPRIEEHQMILRPGDMLVAYTDGITEAMQADYTEWSLDRFKQVVVEHRNKPVPEIAQAILSTVDAFVGGAAQSDDLTLWLLKREY